MRDFLMAGHYFLSSVEGGAPQCFSAPQEGPINLTPPPVLILLLATFIYYVPGVPLFLGRPPKVRNFYSNFNRKICGMGWERMMVDTAWDVHLYQMAAESNCVK